MRSTTDKTTVKNMITSIYVINLYQPGQLEILIMKNTGTVATSVNKMFKIVEKYSYLKPELKKYLYWFLKIMFFNRRNTSQESISFYLSINSHTSYLRLSFSRISLKGALNNIVSLLSNSSQKLNLFL